jgi:hypothetical protein
MDLPTMQNYRLIQYLIIFLFYLNLSAQPEYWYQMYTNNNMAELDDLLKTGKIDDPDWKSLIECLFIEEMDLALHQYVQIYENSNNLLLKRVVLDRISQYYYSKGLYDTAKRIVTDEKFRNQIFSLKKRTIYFGVQLGAFSSYENALKSKNSYSGRLKELSIITKNKNGRKLYLIVAGKYNIRQNAEILRENIKHNLREQGLVIQY